MKITGIYITEEARGEERRGEERQHHRRIGEFNFRILFWQVARREALIVEFSSERFSNGLLHKAESRALKNVNDEHKAGNDFYLSFPSRNNIGGEI